ncbi:MAG TPA: VCBS repeat-containing protein, partial [Vicinamibacteria bacterium]
MRFEDHTAAGGFDVVTWSGGKEKNHIVESTGNGVLLLDYDSDGFLDVYFVNAIRLLPGRKTESHSNALYRNRGDGTFAEVTGEAGLGSTAFGVGGAVADVDNDGLLDIYVTNWGPNTLFRNNGDGTFTDRTESSGVGDPRWSVGAVFFDPDNDGDADLFVANYIETSWDEVWDAKRVRSWRGRVNVLDGPRGLPGSRNTYYRNEGDGTFTDATEASGFLQGSGQYSMGAVSFDYDDDGDVDLYVANDSMPNGLYRNRGDGVFEEMGALSGAAYNADGAT